MSDIAYYYRKHRHYRAKERQARFMLRDRQLAAAYGSSAAAAWGMLWLAVDELVDKTETGSTTARGDSAR